jgi:hypothetical protein
VTMKKTQAGTLGSLAYFEDREGSVMGLWQTAGKILEPLTGSRWGGTFPQYSFEQRGAAHTRRPVA